MSPATQAVLTTLAILAINALMWAIILPIVRAKGRRQIERHGSVPAAIGRELAEYEGKGH